MESDILLVVGTLGGAIIGSLSTVFITFITKKSEERKHFKGLVINTAFESWKSNVELSKIQSKNRDVNILPLDTYIVHMLKVSELIFSNKINKTNIEKILNEADEITKIAVDYKIHQDELKNRNHFEVEDPKTEISKLHSQGWVGNLPPPPVRAKHSRTWNALPHSPLTPTCPSPVRRGSQTRPFFTHQPTPHLPYRTNPTHSYS